ncbi:hypothetical protein D3C87_1881490 [compost metagenome]
MLEWTIKMSPGAIPCARIASESSGRVKTFSLAAEVKTEAPLFSDRRATRLSKLLKVGNFQ